nr:hypothetical protein [Tanacetum cinerariifolium]
MLGYKKLQHGPYESWGEPILTDKCVRRKRLDAYESSISYKERTKRWHDKRIKILVKYEKGDKVLLFNSRLRLFPRKLKSRWYGPFWVSKDMKNGALELHDEDGREFIVNKQRVKQFQNSLLDTNREVIFDEKKLGSS